MRGVLLILAVFGIGVGVYFFNKQNHPAGADQSQPDTVVTSSTDSAAHVSASGTPAEVGPPATASNPVTSPANPPVSAPRQNLAPAGTYYLVKRVSISTDSGIIAAVPGTKVTLVSSGPPMKVSDGQNEFDVDASEVTNDLDVASKVFSSDQAAQASIMAMRRAESEKALKEMTAQQPTPTPTPVPQQQAGSSQGWSNPLEAAPVPVNTPKGYDRFGNPIWAGKIH